MSTLVISSRISSDRENTWLKILPFFCIILLPLRVHTGNNAASVMTARTMDAAQQMPARTGGQFNRPSIQAMSSGRDAKTGLS
jgi:hypothetical protein